MSQKSRKVREHQGVGERRGGVGGEGGGAGGEEGGTGAGGVAGG